MWTGLQTQSSQGTIIDLRKATYSLRADSHYYNSYNEKNNFPHSTNFPNYRGAEPFFCSKNH